MSFIKQSTSNFEKSVSHLLKYGCISIACIFCEDIYNINNTKFLNHRNKTLFCNECGLDTIIPITIDSILFDLNNKERSLMRWVDKYKSTNNITRNKRDYKAYKMFKGVKLQSCIFIIYFTYILLIYLILNFQVCKLIMQIP